MPAFKLIKASELIRVIDLAHTACAGTQVDPERLAAWLIDQDDPDWLHPAPVHWWAQHIARHGYPEEKS